MRVTNLSESTREQDLQELFKSFGDIVRIFLAKDKNTGVSKGFAFINFKVSNLFDAKTSKIDIGYSFFGWYGCVYEARVETFVCFPPSGVKRLLRPSAYLMATATIISS